MKNQKHQKDLSFRFIIASSKLSNEFCPKSAFSVPNIRHKVAVVIQSNPKPIEQAVMDRKNTFKMRAQDPCAINIPPKAKPKLSKTRINLTCQHAGIVSHCSKSLNPVLQLHISFEQKITKEHDLLDFYSLLLIVGLGCIFKCGQHRFCNYKSINNVVCFPRVRLHRPFTIPPLPRLQHGQPGRAPPCYLHPRLST